MPIVRSLTLILVSLIIIFTLTLVFTTNTQSDQEQSNLSHLYQSEPLMLISSEEMLGIASHPANALCPQQFTESELLQGHNEMVESPPTPYGKAHYIGEVSGGDVTVIDAGNTYHLITPNQPLEANFIFYHRSMDNAPIDMRLVMLHNYQQIPMDNGQPYTDISALSGENTWVRLSIPPLEEGVHDIVVLGWSPSGVEIGDDIIDSLQHTIYNKITIFVGDLNMRHTGQYYHLRPTIQSGTPVIERGYILIPHLQPVENDWEVLWWNYPEAYVAVEEALNFYASMGYTGINNLDQTAPSHKPITAALMAFIDGRQVKLAPNYPAYLALIDPDNSFTSVPITLTEKELPFSGKQEMVFARINHPYMPNCWLNPNFNTSLEMYRVGVDFGE